MTATIRGAEMMIDEYRHWLFKESERRAKAQLRRASRRAALFAVVCWIPVALELLRGGTK